VVGLIEADGADAGPVPTALVAFTVNVYAVPLVNPVTVAVSAPVVVAVFDPGLDVTVYPLIAEPPLDDGATHDTVTAVLAATPVTEVGAPGTTGSGVTAADGADAAPVLTAFLAVTVNVYGVPFVSPVTVAVTAPVVVAVRPPGEDVTV